MRALILLPDRNSPGKSDYTGAFRIEARAFAKLHGIPATDVVEIDCSKPKPHRRKQVLNAFAARSKEPLELVAFFCHGIWRALPQFDLQLDHMLVLAGQLASTKVQRLVVAVYACLTADGPGPGGDGGLADLMRDRLCAAGATCRIDAHETKGHTDANPRVMRFEGQWGTPGGTGGSWIVEPGSALWKRWVRSLAQPTRENPKGGHLRLRFPLMSTEEIHKTLREAA